MTAAAAVAAGALLLVWPAFANGYPILFSDTAAFLDQTLGPLMIWDKPWVYGPLMHLFHWQVSLWPVALAQGAMVSALLWLLQRVLRGPGGAAGDGVRVAWHLGLCLLLAVLTAAPFVTALLMPDIFAPVVILGALLLGPGRDRLRGAEAWAIGLLLLLGTAAHLSHLPLAAGLAVLCGLLALPRGAGAALRAGGRVALPLLGALALLVVSNGIGHGRWAVSPYGATFLLARLVADGPAARTIAAECPARGWYLCAWAGRLPTDSDIFLWAPESPVNRDAAGARRELGGMLLAPEAGEILRATLAREPAAVAVALLRNTVEQLGTAQIGDALIAGYLAEGLRPHLVEGFPAREVAAFDAGDQRHDRLLWRFAGLGFLHALVLWAALALLPLAAWHVRQDRLRLALIATVLAGLLGNAMATGGLSGPHHRYQARVVWLLPLAVALCWLPGRARREEALPPPGPSSARGTGVPLDPASVGN